MNTQRLSLGLSSMVILLCRMLWTRAVIPFRPTMAW
tara:strand:+ start:91583 stop:91690 length:108 start_codon:yes stop_codon:yes gene_type:complete